VLFGAQIARNAVNSAPYVRLNVAHVSL
jgi:hypothetical protein